MGCSCCVVWCVVLLKKPEESSSWKTDDRVDVGLSVIEPQSVFCFDASLYLTESKNL